ncbi:MAG: translocation/assembly module TamB domain-containing protein [Terriglobales bacterium]
MSALPQPPFSNSGRPELAGGGRGPRPLWKRLLAWIGAGLAALLVLVVFGVIVLLHSDRFHAYVLRIAQEKATQAIGSSTQLKDFTLGWSGSGPTVELHDLVIQGAAPHADPPLLRIDSLRVQITIQSLLHRTWYVSDVRIEHPVVHFLADHQGRTNLPHAESQSSSQNQIDVFALGIRHLVLERGEIYYNNRKSDLNGDVRDLLFQSSFSPLLTQYSGSLSYQNGQIQWQNANPVAHSLDARFTATPKQFTLQSAVLRTAKSRFSLRATARDYAQPLIHGTYQATLDSGEFRRALKNPSLPAGLIDVSGAIDYQREPGRQFLASTTLHGSVRSAELSVAHGNESIQLRDLAAEYTVKQGDAMVTGIRAQALGGRLDGTLAMRDLAGSTRSTLAVSLKHISASDLQNIFGPATADRAVLGGSLDADAHATWGKTLDDLVARAEINLQASLEPARGGNKTPVNGRIHANYDARRELLALRQSYVKTPQLSISLDGTVSHKSSLQVHAESNQLHELEELATAFRATNSTPLGLYGRATFGATISGSTRSPDIRGQLSATDLRLKGTSWKLLRTQFTASPSAVRLNNAELVSSTQGHIGFQLDAALHNWVFQDSSPFHLQLTASGLSASELAKVAGVTTQVDGTFSATVTASGTQLAPLGHGKLELTHASVADEPIKTATVRFDANGTTISAKIDADLPAGSATGNVKYAPEQQRYELEVHADGIKLAQLDHVKDRNLQVAGTVNLNASGQGTLQDPNLLAVLEVPQLQVRGQAINNLKLTANVANRVAKLDLTSQMLGSHAEGHGTVQLKGDYPVDFALDTQILPLQPVFAIYAPTQGANLTGQTELHLTVQGPLKAAGQLEAHVVIPQLKLNYKNTIQLAATRPILADYVHGTLEIKRSVIRGTGTDLTFQAEVPAAKSAPVSILLRGTVDLQLAELFDPDVSSAGQIRFDIDTFGQRSNPDVEGQIHIVNASFAKAGIPLGLRDGNGLLTLTRNRLDVTEFKGKAGGGTLSATGGVVYRPNLQFDLALKGEGVRVVYEQNIRATLASSLALTGNYNDALLRGQVNIEQLSLTSNADLMELVGQFGGAAPPPPPTGGLKENLRLQIAVQTPGGVNLSSRDLSLAGSANLRLRGTAAQPVVMGRVNLTDGDLIFSGNRYLVQSATIDFRNSTRTEAVVNVAVNTTIDQYNIQMHLWGPAEHLHTNYSSDPSLPPSDIINLVAFGKTSEAAAANPTPGTLGAQSLIASQVSSQVTSRIEKLAGISQLSVDPVLGGGQQSPGARIAIKQKVTSKIFVTYATDVTSSQQQAIEVEYEVNRRMSLSAARNQNGGFSFEASFRKDW